MTGAERGGRGRLAAAIAALVLLAAMLIVSVDFGFTWDERFQQQYGDQVWAYFRGELPRAHFDTAGGNQYLYGGLVEVLAVGAQRLLPAVDPYVVRHAVVSVIGWLGIVYTGRTAAALGGPLAGWLAAVLLALSPRYLGDAMNNPKDIPLAAFTMMALYYAITVPRTAPYLTWRHAARLAGSIALALNVRPLGLMVLGFSGLVAFGVSAAGALANREPAPRRALMPVAAKLLAVALVAIPLGTLAWPWAHAQPILRPIEAFLIASRLDWAGGFHVLYAGQDFGADRLPWHYVPLWVLISTPPVVLLGLVLLPAAWRRWPGARLPLLALAAFSAAPVAAAIVRHATLYDAIRHLLFMMPPLFALAGTAWSASLQGGSRRIRAVTAAVLAVGLLEPLVFQVRNHPNQIVYFSPLMGGPSRAFARFDMDYWGNSMLQAVDWSAQLARRVGMPIVVSGNPPQAVEADAARYRALWFARRNSPDYHLDIRLLRGPRDSVREFAARPDILHRVTTADGTPLCLVLPGPAFGALRARMEKAGVTLPFDGRRPAAD